MSTNLRTLLPISVRPPVPRLAYLAGVLGLFLYAGCNQADPPSPGVESRAAEIAGESVVAVTPPTRKTEPLGIDESEEFAAEFEAAVMSRDHNGITKRIEWPALLAKATEGLDSPEGFREQFVKDALREKGSLARQLSSAASSGGFRLLRVYSEAGEMRALFRSILSSGVKYQELILGRNAEGKVCATDVYFYRNAERLSLTMRRMFLLAAAEQPSNPLGGLLSRDNDFVRHAEEFRQMPAKLSAGKGKEVLETYAALPPQMKSEKTVMLLYLLAAEQVDDEAYAVAIDRFRKEHPDDPCLDMVSIDGFVLRGQYDEALAAVDRIDKAIGGDPYINVVRANIHIMRGDLADGEMFAQRALELEPELIDAYWALVTVTLAEKRFAETAEWLSTIRDKFQVKFDDLRKIPDYADFVQSPEYAEWSHESKPAHARE